MITSQGSRGFRPRASTHAGPSRVQPGEHDPAGSYFWTYCAWPTDSGQSMRRRLVYLEIVHMAANRIRSHRLRGKPASRFRRGSRMLTPLRQRRLPTPRKAVVPGDTGERAVEGVHDR